MLENLWEAFNKMDNHAEIEVKKVCTWTKKFIGKPETQIIVSLESLSKQIF